MTRDDAIESLRFVVPLVTVVVVLFMGRSPAMAGFVAIVTAIVIALVIDILDPAKRSALATYHTRFLAALKRGGAACGQILVAVGSIGTIASNRHLSELERQRAELVAVRERRMNDHVTWMARSYAIAWSAIAFRLIQIPLFAAGVGANANYVASLWSSLALSVLLGEWGAAHLRGVQRATARPIGAL